MEYGVWVERIQTVGDIQVVADVCIGIVGIAIPWTTVNVRFVQFTGVVATKVGNCNSSGIACINLRKH